MGDYEDIEITAHFGPDFKGFNPPVVRIGKRTFTYAQLQDHGSMRSMLRAVYEAGYNDAEAGRERRG